MTGDDAGNVWFGFSNNVVEWDGSSYHRFSFPNGTRGVSETTMYVRGDRVWLGGSGGVELLRKGHFYLLGWKNQDLPGRVSGVMETGTGDLWMNGFSGITHVSAAELARWLRDPSYLVSGERFDALDGLPGLSAERILSHRWRNRVTAGCGLPPPGASPGSTRRCCTRVATAYRHPVLITSIISNGKTYSGSGELTLPAHTERLQIDYTALSLAIPDRVLFRYKLDGVDSEWQDVGTRRQAFYTQLPPGHYRFHVIACNNDGVWNEVGASLGVSIKPAFYQTWWFTALVIFAAAGLLWWAIRLRIRGIARQLQGRLAERVAERERIARELHEPSCKVSSGSRSAFTPLPTGCLLVILRARLWMRR